MSLLVNIKRPMIKNMYIISVKINRSETLHVRGLLMFLNNQMGTTHTYGTYLQGQ